MKVWKLILIFVVIFIVSIIVLFFFGVFSLNILPYYETSTLSLDSERPQSVTYSLSFSSTQSAISNVVGSKVPCEPSSSGCTSPDFKHVYMDFEFILYTIPTSMSVVPKLAENLQLNKEFKAKRCDVSSFGAQYELNRAFGTQTVLERLDCYCWIKSMGIYNNIERADLSCRFEGRVRTNNEPSPLFTSPVEFTGLNNGEAQVEILREGFECLNDDDCGFGERCENYLCESAFVCTSGEKKCVEDNAMICINNQWNVDRTCEFGCIEGQCLTTPPVPKPLIVQWFASLWDWIRNLFT